MQHRHPSINTLTSLLGRNQTALEAETPRLLRTPPLVSGFPHTVPAPYSTDFFLLSILSLPVPVHFMSVSLPAAPPWRCHSRCLLLSPSLAFFPINISNFLNFQGLSPVCALVQVKLPIPFYHIQSFRSFLSRGSIVTRAFSLEKKSLFPFPLESWILMLFPHGS